MQVINRKWLLSRTLLIIFILLTPLIQVCLIKGADRYKFGSDFEEKYSYIARKIYSEKGPVDFLFLGPSQTRDSLNARLIQDSLSSQFKQKSVAVENFGHNDLGIDLEYLMLKDAVEQRGVKVVFVGVGGGKIQNEFHRVSRFLWNPFEDEFLETLYAEKILESFPFITKFLFTQVQYIDKGQWDSSNGSTIVSAGYSDGGSPDKNVPFTTVPPSPKFHKLQELTLSGEKILSTGTFNEFQMVYLRKIMDLAKKNNIKLYFLSYPMIASDNDPTKVDVLLLPKKSDVVAYLGIPENVLFGTDSRDEMKKYFWNPIHTNANGNMQYTLSILPALMEIYESSIR